VAALLLGTGIGLAFAAMVNPDHRERRAGRGGSRHRRQLRRPDGRGAFGGAVVASILAATVSAGGYPSAHGYTVAFVACATALILGAAVGLAIPQRSPADAFAPREAGDLPGT
jgi:hypothetical protein